jgi:hypothetical protein
METIAAMRQIDREAVNIIRINIPDGDSERNAP